MAVVLVLALGLVAVAATSASADSRLIDHPARATTLSAHDRVFVTPIAGRRRTPVRRLDGGGMSGHAIGGVSWVGQQSLQWAEICGGDPGGCPGTTRLGQWMPGEAVRFAPAPLRLLAYATSNRTAWTLSDCLPALAADGPPCTLLERSPAPLVPYGT